MLFWKIWQILKVYDFDFFLFWLGLWYESIVWVIIGRRGYPQNAGILVTLVDYVELSFLVWSSIDITLANVWIHICAWLVWPLNFFMIWSSLTHWGRDEMDNISQATFSNALSSMKMLKFRLEFHWSLFLRVQLTISQHWFR